MKRHIANLSLMAVMAFGITASPAAAQDRPDEGRQPDPTQRIERRIERLDEKLNLTDEQEQQIRQALDETARETKEYLADSRGKAQQNREAHREYLRTQREEMDHAIMAALTPEQQEQYKALKAERTDRGERGDRDRGRMMRQDVSPEQMAQHLNYFAREFDLTDAQQEQVKQLFLEHHEALRSWMESNPDASREERQAYVAERMKEGSAQLESVLNAEQLEKFRAWQEEMKQKMEERLEQRGERPDPQGGHEHGR